MDSALPVLCPSVVNVSSGQITSIMDCYSATKLIYHARTPTKALLSYCRSFFQSVCILGYCLLPEALALIACRIFAIALHGTLLFALRITVIMVGFLWATWGNKMKMKFEALYEQY